MGERRMTDVVAERESFGEFFVEIQRRGYGAGDLRDFDGMGEPVAKMVRDSGGENLGFVFKAAKSPRMDNAVAIALEFAAIRMRKFGISPATASFSRKAQAA